MHCTVSITAFMFRWHCDSILTSCRFLQLNDDTCHMMPCPSSLKRAIVYTLAQGFNCCYVSAVAELSALVVLVLP